MKFLKFLMVGLVFGIVLAKSEVISWYRIYEMFRFHSFHMYGIIGTAVVLGVLIVQVIKRFKVKSFYGEPIEFQPKDKSFARYLTGGFIFGLGWALAGACPGPMFTLVGAGYLSILIVILGAVAGTWAYGLIKDKLPH